jgi:hypothetical protein
MKPLPALAATAVLALATGDMAHAIDTIEAVGAERCGGPVKAFEVEFLAPDNASLAGTAQAM